MGDDYKRAGAPRRSDADGSAGRAGHARRRRRAFDAGSSTKSAATATTDEVVALARVAGAPGGFYISHIRDEADKAFEAMREVVTIAEQAQPAGAEHAHQARHRRVSGAAPRRRWRSSTRRARAGLDVTADAYPYDAWSSTITVLIPSKRYDDPGRRRPRGWPTSAAPRTC